MREKWQQMTMINKIGVAIICYHQVKSYKPCSSICLGTFWQSCRPTLVHQGHGRRDQHVGAFALSVFSSGITWERWAGGEVRLRMGPKQQIGGRLDVGKSTPLFRITSEIFMESWGWSSNPPGLLRMPGSDLGNYLIGQAGINKQVRQLERLLARH